LVVTVDYDFGDGFGCADAVNGRAQIFTGVLFGDADKLKRRKREADENGRVVVGGRNRLFGKRLNFTRKYFPFVCTVDGNGSLDNFDQVIVIGLSPSAVHMICALSPRLTICRDGFSVILGSSETDNYYGENAARR